MEGLIDMERKGCESIIHDCDLWVTMVGWVDVPDNDWVTSDVGMPLTYLVCLSLSPGANIPHHTRISRISITNAIPMGQVRLHNSPLLTLTRFLPRSP